MYYLDNAATTQLTKEVKDRIIDVLDEYGNPSSIYSIGLRSKKIIEDARYAVAKFINAPANSEIIFTSSGSSANCLAIKGLVGNSEDIIVLYSPTAHKSMIKCCESCKYKHKLKVDNNGFIDEKDLSHKLEEFRYENIIVCFELANSEIGTIQNLYDLTKLIHRYHGIVVVDITGYIPYKQVNILDMDIDVATFSGHKLHALKGVGVLYKISDINIQPLIYGTQENGYFAGTENVVGISSLGKAVETYSYNHVSTFQRDRLFRMIKERIPDCFLVGSRLHRLPMNLFICFPGCDSMQLVSLLEKDDIYVSTGSACNNGSKQPSNTLTSIGLSKEFYNSCIRITFSGYENELDLEYIADKINKNVIFLRESN